MKSLTPASSEAADLALSIAEFTAGLKYEALDAETVLAAKKLILDAFAVTIGGIPEAGARELSRILVSQGGSPEAMIIGTGVKVPADRAAMANAVMCRSLDFDDVSEMALMHTTAPVVPATLAAAQAAPRPIDGKEFLTAVTLGIDLANRISLAGLARRDPTAPRVMSPTFLIAPFAAAAAASRIWGLDVDRIVNALGLAHSQASGNQQGAFDGALSVRIQQGLSTAVGVFSARMAAEGITGPHRSFEGKAGHFAIHWQGKYDRSIMLDGLGSKFSVKDVSIKPYPSCKFTHNAIFACLDLRQQNPDLTAQDIDHIDVHIPSREYFDLVCLPIEVKQNPQTQVDAQFSIPFNVAIALVKGAPQPEDFFGDGLHDSTVRGLSKKVRPILQEPLTTDLPAPAKVDIHLNNGRQLSTSSRFPPGHPSRPMSWDELAEKLDILSKRPDKKFPSSKQKAMVETCRSLETCLNINQWADDHLQW